MKAIGDSEKRKRGRPRTHAKPVMVRLYPAMIEWLDRFCRFKGAKSRPDAIREIIEEFRKKFP